MTANLTSEFQILAKPRSISQPIIKHGSVQEDIIQLTSYRTNDTTGGEVQRVWGYEGADIFNVNFELPGDGKVGIDFNTGNLKKLAQMLVEPDWDVRAKRIAMDVAHATAGAAIDYANAATSSIPIIGSVSDAAATSAHLAIDLANITAHGVLDIEEYNNNLAAIDDFFKDQNNQDWGSVNILDARTVVEIKDFQPGIDTITLPKLPTNWVWELNTGVFDDGQNYVSLSFKNGTNVSGEVLRIGFEQTLSSLIPLGSREGLIGNLLNISNSGWAIGKTIKQNKGTLDPLLNGTITNDLLFIDERNTNQVVKLSGGLGDDVPIGRLNGNDSLDGSQGNDYIKPGGGLDTINGGSGYDRVDYSNLTTAINVTSSDFISIEGVIGTKFDDIAFLNEKT